MKKFGTPIAAGPGNANENVGFDGVGTPPDARIGPGFEGREFAGPPPEPGAAGFEALCFFDEEDFCLLDEGFWAFG